MADVDKCVDCGARGATVYKKDRRGQDDTRSSPRCSLCATHFELAVIFKRKMFDWAVKADCQRRDRLLTLRARRNRKGARHCSKCHGYRAADAFLKGAGAFGHCALCRDISTAHLNHLDGIGGMAKTFQVAQRAELAAQIRAGRADMKEATLAGKVEREIEKAKALLGGAL